jgi:hypothetical protein
MRADGISQAYCRTDLAAGEIIEWKRVQDDLIHLLTIAARVLALGDYLAKQALAQEKSELAGVYSGNPMRSTARPITERMLQAFENINLLIFPVQPEPLCYLTELSDVQKRILALLGLPESLYLALQSA